MNKLLFTGLIATGTLLATGTALAATSLGSVTTPSGVEVPKVSISGNVESVSNTGRNQIQVKESDGNTYTVNLGKRGYADTDVNVGDAVKVDGLERVQGTVSAWTLTKADGSLVTIRTEAGKPPWAGAGKGGNGNGMGGHGAGFVDSDGDGICDNANR